MLKQINSLPLTHMSTGVTNTKLEPDIDNIAAMHNAEKSPIEHNYTLHLQFEDDPILATRNAFGQVSATSAISSSATDVEYEQFLADVWVGVVLTLMVLSCVCCMCSCLLYHKFQQWKRSVIAARHGLDVESAQYDVDILPSYTIASGLPSYAEALTQLKTARECCKIHNHSNNLENRRESLLAQLQVPKEVIIWLPNTPQTSRTSLAIADLFQVYRRNSLNTAAHENIKTYI